MLVVDENFRLKRMAKLAANATNVLDVGYADQPNIYLANQNVVGVDLQPATKPQNYTATYVGSLLEFSESYGQGFDAVLAGEILEHVEDPLGFLRECHGVLAPQGQLVLSTPNPHSIMEQVLTISLSRKYYYTRDHIMLFPQRWLIRMLELVGFSNVCLYSGGFPIPGLGLVPFPRPWCYQTIAVAVK